MKQLIRLVAALPTLSSTEELIIVFLLSSGNDISFSKKNLIKKGYKRQNIELAIKYIEQVQLFVEDLPSWHYIVNEVWQTQQTCSISADDLLPLTIAAIPTHFTKEGYDCLLTKLDQASRIVQSTKEYCAANLWSAISHIIETKKIECCSLHAEILKKIEEKRQNEACFTTTRADTIAMNYLLKKCKEYKEYLSQINKKYNCHQLIHDNALQNQTHIQASLITTPPSKSKNNRTKQQLINELLSILEDQTLIIIDKLTKFKLHFESKDNQQTLKKNTNSLGIQILHAIIRFLTFSYIEPDKNKNFTKKSQKILTNNANTLFVQLNSENKAAKGIEENTSAISMRRIISFIPLSWPPPIMSIRQ